MFSNVKIPKSFVAAVFGVTMLIAHFLLTIALFAIAELQSTSIDVISIPVTAAFIGPIVRWVLQNQGRLNRSPKVGIFYVVVLALLAIFYFSLLIAGPVAYLGNANVLQSESTLNTYFAIIDGLFGAFLVQFSNDLFSSKED